jgi:proteic killer suppression protein
VDIQNAAYRKLAIIHSANALIDLRSPPGNRFEKLRGDRSGQYSIRINDRWRVYFEWQGKDAYNVEIVNYHK